MSKKPSPPWRWSTPRSDSSWPIADRRALYCPDLMLTQIEWIRDEVMAMDYFGERVDPPAIEVRARPSLSSPARTP